MQGTLALGSCFVLWLRNVESIELTVSELIFCVPVPVEPFGQGNVRT